MSDHTIFSLSQMINPRKTGNTSFNILDKVEYVINLYSIKAVEKGITLMLKREPCFPSEVTGNKTLFELILATVYHYLIQKTFKGEIKLYIKVKSPFEGQLLLGFDFECAANEVLTVDDLRSSFMTSKSIDMSPVFPFDTWKSPKHAIKQPYLLIKHMNGDIEIFDSDSSTIKFEIELPFSTQTSVEVHLPDNKINIFRVERPGEFVKVWTSVVGPSELTLSPKVARRPLMITRATTEKTLGEENIKNKIKLAVSKLPYKSKGESGRFGALSASNSISD